MKEAYAAMAADHALKGESYKEVEGWRDDDAEETPWRNGINEKAFHEEVDLPSLDNMDDAGDDRSATFLADSIMKLEETEKRRSHTSCQALLDKNTWL